MDEMTQPAEVPEAQAVPCVHIYQLADGSYGIERSEAPAPTEGLEPVASLDEALSKAGEMLQAPPEEGGDDAAAMDSMMAGYKRKAAPAMAAPNPKAVFGE